MVLIVAIIAMATVVWIATAEPIIPEDVPRKWLLKTGIGMVKRRALDTIVYGMI